MILDAISEHESAPPHPIDLRCHLSIIAKIHGTGFRHVIWKWLV